ncbi:MAG: ABC transporter permease subunit, partial [Candidatus Dormibacteria bacterium]
MIASSFFSSLLSSGVLALPNIGVYLLFGVGLVVIYRASRVLNLAHGAFALVPAYVFYSLGTHHLPLPVAAAAGVAGGAAFGAVTERFVVRRLRRQGVVAQTVGTVAVYGFTVALAVKLYGSAPLLPPRLLPLGSIGVADGTLRVAAIWLFVIGCLVSAACLALFRFTDFGKAMRAAADNRRAAALMGVDPDRTTLAAWTLGGGLAGLAGVLVGTYDNVDAFTLGLQVLPAFVAALLGGLESFSGVLVGSLLVALVEAEIPTIATLPGLGSLGTTAGASQLILMLVAFVVLAFRGQKLVGSAAREAGVGTARPPRVRTWRRGRERRAAVVATVVAVILVLFPFLPFVPFSLVGDAILVAYYLLAAVSIVVLTGWVGQISLAQAELVGVGAFVSALAMGRWHIPFPLSLFVAAAAGGVVAALLGGVALRVRGLYLAVATLVFAWMADSYLFHQQWFGIIGGSAQATAPDLGTPGTLPYFDFTSTTLVYVVVLAVTVWVVYCVANVADSKTGRAFFALRGSEVAAASLGINVTRYKLLAFVTAGAIAGTAGNLILLYQRSVDPSQFDILTSLFFLGIAVVGGLSSLGGAVGASVVFAALYELFFRVRFLAGFLDVVSSSLLLGVLLLYPGGLAAAGEGLLRRWEATQPQRERLRRRVGALAEQVTVRLRHAWDARRKPAVTEAVVTSAGRPPEVVRIGEREVPPWRRQLSAVVARLHLDALGGLGGRLVRARRAPATVPGGHDALSRLAFGGSAAEELASATASMLGSQSSHDAAPLVEAAAAVAEAGVLPLHRAPRRRLAVLGERAESTVLLHAQDVTVRFGGLVAVRDASLQVRNGEIVGLIGPNGAGKTTLFNVISGLVTPTEGSVEILGVDATGLPVHERARLGMGRTFQAIQLFSQLSVFENLLVATHLRNTSRVLGHFFALPGAIVREVSMRARVEQVVGFLGMEEIALRPITDLSFGQLRIVELARALVTGSQLLLLDEPASGLDTKESAAFAELLLGVRESLGISMLLIEHDIATVTGVSDYMYVLEQGQIIAEGTPQTVQADPAVIEAYLGRPLAAGT